MNEDLYPVTIVKDRYNGAYSGGKYTAWNRHPCIIPNEIFYDDVTCAAFWDLNLIPCGIGETPEEAERDLVEKMRTANRE